ncbi:MAG: serine/threonine protein kinase, partial [Deltaproteobacteria bacterium]|nr:serine/threonine protein kinase [Deltaproteobacteria bacterium]
MIGQTLAHYEIIALLGKGGMGEVYRARDTKLSRDVALKLLPREFALDNERVARFQREARTLASLSHPNIAQIYGLEQDGEHRFLVMELIEGDELGARLGTAPIPFDESLEIAEQMAQALEAAHEQGVIHRDLKPANVKLTATGQVKLLDFG